MFTIAIMRRWVKRRERTKTMGSTTKSPKKNDTALVRVRKQPGTDGGNGGSSPMGGEYCPMSVKLPLPSGVDVGEASSVQLGTTNTGAAVFFGKKKVLDLTSVKAERIKKCLEMGFKYPGRVLTSGGRYYVQFERTS